MLRLLRSGGESTEAQMASLCAACGQCHPKPKNSGQMAGLASRAARANARAIVLSSGWTIGA